MNEHLCLDIGNVLCKVDFNPFRNGLSKNLNLSYEEVDHFLNRVQKIHDLGLTNLEDELRDHFKIKSPVIIEELNDLWKNKTLIPNWEVIDAIRVYCKKNNVKLALLSNIGYEHASYFEEKVFPYTSTEGVKKWFSCFIGARKPSLIYYQSFLTQNPSFQGALYIDDNKDNLVMGKKMGFNSKYFNLCDDFQGIDASPIDIYLKDKLIQIIESEIGNKK